MQGNTEIRTVRQAIHDAISAEMARDETVIVIGEDQAGGASLAAFEHDDAWGGNEGVTAGLVAQFGRRRVLDTPISESAFIGAAMGAAAMGLRPVADLMFSDFLGVCLDQIFNQGAKFRYMSGGQVSVPVVVRSMIGAGLRLAAQHSGSHYSVFTHFPGIKTVVPSTPSDAKGLLTAAIRDPDPVMFFEHRYLYDLEGEVPKGEHIVPLGVADIKRVGSDITVVAIGRMVHVALEAASAVSRNGINAEVVDPRTLSPLDIDTIAGSVNNTGHLIVVDEDNPRCSVAADICAQVTARLFRELKAPPKMVTSPHAPVPFSPVLEDAYIPTPARVEQEIYSSLNATKLLADR